MQRTYCMCSKSLGVISKPYSLEGKVGLAAAAVRLVILAKRPGQNSNLQCIVNL